MAVISWGVTREGGIQFPESDYFFRVVISAGRGTFRGNGPPSVSVSECVCGGQCCLWSGGWIRINEALKIHLLVLKLIHAPRPVKVEEDGEPGGC